ncbi:MAG: hypothetical protein CM1200mP36_01880 [Gammaproteobacteria bacterium]|nr:MAG: hypothetical protein CM1200mP36_01880 [Gammaproteobacteria bacterium]
MAEDDWEVGLFSGASARPFQLVGDDLFVTNTRSSRRASRKTSPTDSDKAQSDGDFDGNLEAIEVAVLPTIQGRVPPFGETKTPPSQILGFGERRYPD